MPPASRRYARTARSKGSGRLDADATDEAVLGHGGAYHQEQDAPALRGRDLLDLGAEEIDHAPEPLTGGDLLAHLHLMAEESGTLRADPGEFREAARRWHVARAFRQHLEAAQHILHPRQQALGD